MTEKEPNWQRLCADTSYADWDCERGHAISSDLWWTDGSIHFSWVYGYRKFNLEITDGLWHSSEKDGSWRQSIDGHLPDEVYDKLQTFYRKCLKDKYRKL